MSQPGHPEIREHANPGKIGIVTVTYNSVRLLDDFLRSLDQQEYTNWHAYIIDNDSKDQTVANINARNLDPLKYSIVVNAKNVGVAAGNNQGILMAEEDGCEWILLINNDTIFPPQLFGHLVQVAESQGWRMVVPKIHFNLPPNAVWYGGGGFDRMKGHTGCHTGIGQPDVGQFDLQKTVDYSPTCCMLIHRTVFETVGLMDECYFAYFDDTDFCWRLKLAGIAIGYAPKHVLIHKVGSSTGGTASPFYARMTARNRLYFLKKYFGRTAPVRWLVIFLPYYMFRYLVKNWNPAAFRASIEGTLAYRGMVENIPKFPDKTAYSGTSLPRQSPPSAGR
jgi:GT2 family glycosyltransferase